MTSSDPVRTTLEICNLRGLHARASAKFVQCAEQYDAEITVSRENQSVIGTSIMGLLTLGAGPGSTITVEATGSDAAEALEALSALVTSGFGEELQES